MRKKIVAGNWKMNTTLAEGIALAKEVSSFVTEANLNSDKGVVIAPPFIHLTEILKNVNTDKICVAAQNCAADENGAFTGEVSESMLQNIGVKAVILGHSERRMYYNETSLTLLKKVQLVLKYQMKPIFCIGELLSEREKNIHFDVIKQQLHETVFTLTADDYSKIIIAYEPVWAIGTGVTASPEQAQEMHAYIRSLIAEKFGATAADNTTLLYGGSCKASNAKELFDNKDVDGGLIGGASLKMSEFSAIISAM